jgi:glycosyltransferase involved in cell wall biosynthesis
MEAAACGLPLVASRLSGIPELVLDGENGYLADPGDVQALAQAIERIALSPPLGQQLGNAARRRMETDFNLSITVAELQQLMAHGIAA